jgi:hypothetical protein
VDAKGQATDVRLYRALADSVKEKDRPVALLLDQAAIDAVKQYEFKPTTDQGKPVPFDLNVEIFFQNY